MVGIAPPDIQIGAVAPGDSRSVDKLRQTTPDVLLELFGLVHVVLVMELFLYNEPVVLLERDALCLRRGILGNGVDELLDELERDI